MSLDWSLIKHLTQALLFYGSCSQHLLKLAFYTDANQLCRLQAMWFNDIMSQCIQESELITVFFFLQCYWKLTVQLHMMNVVSDMRMPNKPSTRAQDIFHKAITLSYFYWQCDLVALIWMFFQLEKLVNFCILEKRKAEKLMLLQISESDLQICI